MLNFFLAIFIIINLFFVWVSYESKLGVEFMLAMTNIIISIGIASIAKRLDKIKVQ